MTRGVTLGLDRVEEALARLGHPQARLPAIQIAGTNGKGSTAAATEAILRRAGFRTGLFTSPHLVRFTERIRVAGNEVAGERLAAWEPRIAATGIPLTYFEIATLLAFLAFTEEQVEIAVMETGLGGRLDAVTTCQAIATAITNIALDHTAILGTTLAAIAHEKAGIIKPGVPLSVGRVPPEAEMVLRAEARQRGAPVAWFGEDFQLPPGVEEGTLALRGPHQVSNAAVAARLAEQAANALGRPLSAEVVAEGLASTVWPGRFERIGDVWLDCAHNADGAAALLDAFASVAPSERPTALVTSVVTDKDVDALGALFAKAFSTIVVTRSSSPRAMPPEALAARWRGQGSAAILVEPEPMAALARARRETQAETVAVAGSIFLVGDVRAALLGEERDPVPTGDPAARAS